MRLAILINYAKISICFRLIKTVYRINFFLKNKLFLLKYNLILGYPKIVRKSTLMGNFRSLILNWLQK